MALTFFAIAVSKSSRNVWTRKFVSSSTGTADQTIDFTVNDLMLGTPDPFFWFLVPLFAIISVGICIAANYLLLIITHIFALISSRISAWTQPVSGAARYGTLPRIGFAVTDSSHRRPVSITASATINQRLISTGLLVLLVVTVIPYQFAYMVLCIVQITTCIRSRRASLESATSQNYNFYNYTHSMLVLMLWILPVNMPVLVVWIHNLAVHWLTPFSTHHNLLSVLGYIALVEMMSSGGMIPRVTTQ